ncbi:MAG: T9SS type A sorting domain-containing protein [Bacteroidetes bacterium]|nr:T9SS type A sorting domain-containing protein [Bacteroidota bacterium]
MILTCLRMTINAAMIVVTLLAATAVAQPTFNAGNSQIAIENTSGGNPLVIIDAAGLLFDQDLKLTHRFADVLGGNIQGGDSWGYGSPGLFNGQTAGDIDAVKDTIGCGLYSISVAGTQFFLNLTDANWGAGSANDIYRILIKYDGTSIRIHVSAQGSATSWSAGYMTVSSAGTYTYWDLVRTLQYGSYLRERTTCNNKRFHVTGSDDQLPLESTGVTEATLDVNLDVHVDINVPDNSALHIQGYDEGLTGSSGTVLLFDAQTGLTVYGYLTTITTQYRSEHAEFTSSAGSPAPGDWDGIYGCYPTGINLNHAYITYAVNGLDIEWSWAEVLIYDAVVRYCSGEGVTMVGSSSRIDHLNSDTNYENNLNIMNGEHDVFHSHFDASITQNGVIIGDRVWALFRSCRMSGNAMNGFYAYSTAGIKIDSCSIYENGGSDDWVGVETFYNDEPVRIRYNRIWDQAIGVCAIYGTLFGYYTRTNPVKWDNPDSLGRNCIFWNDYNLYGYEAYYEMARTYYDNGVPHYQGGQNSIFQPNTLQGSFQENSTAYLCDNFWDGNTIFNVSNSTISTCDDLQADSAGCGIEGFGAGGMSLLDLFSNAQAAPVYHAWESLTADSLRRLLAGQLSSLTALEVASGFRLVWNMSDSAAVRTFFAQVVASTTRPEVLRPAYRYLGAARMHDGDHAGAVQAYLAMVQQQPYGSKGYVATQTMAALAMHLGGNTTAARASIDTLLGVFPDDWDLVTIDRLIGGFASTPKRGARIDATPSNDGFELHAAWPNPTAGTSTIAFTLPSAANVDVVLYDVMGRAVRRLASGVYPAGMSSLVLNGGDLPAGLYLLRASANNATRTQTLRILK